jgi:dTDP-4-dehydrorhamnose reductase
MKKVLVLGATGMLGGACMEILERDPEIDLFGTARNKKSDFLVFDAKVDSLSKILGEVKPTWIINCIGIIKPYISENNQASVENAIRINSEFPFLLASAAEKIGSKVIQIATDCVYSGVIGSYAESDLHDATDAYGKTKSSGEVPALNVMHLRVSIIGPEVGRSTSLLEWFRNQPNGAKLNGFTDHIWNGVTTHVFGKICLGIIKNNSFRPGPHHLIPKDNVTKAELLRIFVRAFNRPDIVISDHVNPVGIDRTLVTDDLEFNNILWRQAGYASPPTIEEMVFEQAELMRL